MKSLDVAGEVSAESASVQELKFFKEGNSSKLDLTLF